MRLAIKPYVIKPEFIIMILTNDLLNVIICFISYKLFYVLIYISHSIFLYAIDRIIFD